MHPEKILKKDEPRTILLSKTEDFQNYKHQTDSMKVDYKSFFEDAMYQVILVTYS